MKYFSKFIFISVLVLPITSMAQIAVSDFSAEMALWTNLPSQLEALKAEVAQLENFNWNSSQNLNQMQNLAGYLQQAGNLATSAQSVNNEFQHYFPGYQPPTNYNQQYQQTVNDTQTALNSVMQVMASVNSQQDFMNQNSNLNSIEGQVASAQGSLQAIQGLTQITAQLSTQLQNLQKTIAAQSTAQDAYYAQQVQSDASAQAGFASMLQQGSTQMTPYGSSGTSITIPNF